MIHARHVPVHADHGRLTTAALAGGSPAAAAATCADAAARPVTTSAVFSEPVGGDPVAIWRELCGMVRQAPAEARIQIAHFVMSGAAGTEFADELIKAHRRDVDVRVILDGDTRGVSSATRKRLARGTSRTTTAPAATSAEPNTRSRSG
ncbi:phospholipase D-like domain-containing protein [Nonomuraea polychroma]|uniref:phospholipase D-like domain-containing protein n=1 Tax=Nonomuraea polychroma TaxID=46176 RepID=UPI000FDEE1B1|nr:phospholipase D-like domain-containing protein [Nonomuraea polychroma]